MRSIVQSKRSSVTWLLGIALAACALSACGIPADLSPRDIDPSRQTEVNGK